MGFQARQRDARQVQRINPRIAQQRFPFRVIRGERAVEGRIVRNHVGASHELNEAGQGLRGLRRTFDVCRMDARQVLDRS